MPSICIALLTLYSAWSISGPIRSSVATPDAVQGGECAAVRALQAGANAATRRLWQPKTHLFMGEYLVLLPSINMDKKE
jgi:hypothetical protein